MSIDELSEASSLVNQLIAEGMTPQEISEAMEHRVSYRTIYRWAKKESGPQQKSDLEALREVAGKRPKVAGTVVPASDVSPAKDVLPEVE
jgi:IS30 family transposase